MSLALTTRKTDLQGTVRVVYLDITFDSSYPTGGEPFETGLDTVLSANIEPSGGYIFKYDYTNRKILAYYADYDAVADGALIQVADTTDLSAISTRAKFEGQ
ncbi:MAG: hypothetical protein HUU32_12790 [Calditrichaceae bacterium]|nr:hypothetical protein [Calditrichia bacterium]NUQ42267.1 hypothetical protein [Calditrichaceae bacterium]